MKHLAARHYSTIAQNIRYYREGAGVTQADLADRIGVSQNYISLYETGKRRPTLSALKRISEALDTPLGWIAGEEPERRDLLIRIGEHADSLSASQLKKLERHARYLAQTHRNGD